MTFKEMVSQDNADVFMNSDEFAEVHDIEYDGVTYEHVTCVITQLKEQDRTTTMRDHGQGIYLVTAVFHCRLQDIGGKTPEKGRKFRIYDPDDRFLREYYVAQSACDMDMIRLELEAIDE